MYQSINIVFPSKAAREKMAGIWLRRSSRHIIKNFLVPNYGSNIIINNNNNNTANILGFACQKVLCRSLYYNNNSYYYNSYGFYFPSIFRRLESTKAVQMNLDPQCYSFMDEDCDDRSNQGMDFPGGRVMFTSHMSFIAEYPEMRVPCFRVLNNNGELISNKIFEQVSQDMATRMYISMVTLQIMDRLFYEAQRQGRISFYMASNGEEGVNIASGAALSKDDIVFAQYREPGVLLWRGYTVQEFANQCFGNKADGGKGRQMPVHYGSKKLNFFTISSPIATQLPQAAGAAYSLKMDKKDACVVAYMGDGCTSEGDFHAGMNFAAVMEVPIVFVCRNNGWAISTPVTDQFRSDGIVVKGQAYGIQSIRVDGNDALAVYNVIRAAREIAISEQKPVLIEALTYRVGHHSTSDDSTKYRPVEEIEHWRMEENPVTRFRKWIENKGWWDEEQELEVRNEVKKEIIQAFQVAERMVKPSVSELFTDVYDQVTKDLQEQETFLRETIQRHPKDYPYDNPI